MHDDLFKESSRAPVYNKYGKDSLNNRANINSMSGEKPDGLRSTAPRSNGQRIDTPRPIGLKRPDEANGSRGDSSRVKQRRNSPEMIKKRMMKKFVTIVGLMVGIFLVGASLVLLVYNNTTAASNENFFATPKLSPTPSVDDEDRSEVGAENIGTSDEGLLTPPARTIFLCVGKDKGGHLTDVIMVASFERESKEIKVINVPRDTYTIIPEERLQKLRDAGRYPPRDGVIKINEANSYGGETYGMILLEETLKDLLGVEMDYRIEITTTMFREIVDAVGGVYFDVPAANGSAGLYYNDPHQNLKIALPQGLHLLNGEEAEGLVRFRSYPNGDTDRVSVQQDFLKAMFSQVLQRETIVNNAYNIAKSLLGNITTDFGIIELPKYLRYVNDLNSDKISFQTLPGYGANEEGTGISYFWVNEEQTEAMVKEWFLKDSTPSASNSPSPSPASSKTLKIQVLNGADVGGLAGTWQKELEEKGFTVADIGDFNSERTDHTRILARKENMGADLKALFNDAEIIINPVMDEEYDIIIILGKDDKL
ncbi:MAG: LCP family protein [Clostridiales bacterium]|nr:LCP family protein [Clostridiales bacterium]